MADEQILNLILSNVKELKNDVKIDIGELRKEMNSKFENIEETVKEITNNMVKKNECNEKRENCIKPAELEVIKSEWSYKRIVAIGGIITGTLTASTAAIVAILKIVYG
jgi:hypothetical protein